MKVLFVCSGNSVNGIGAVVANQANALKKQGINISFFPIRGKGLFAYLKHTYLLRKHLKGNKFDLIHGHYSLSAFTATLAGSKPLIVSLMGSDSRAGKFLSAVIRFLNQNRWRSVIVKSASMKGQLKIKNTHIIPNGVDMSVFQPINDSSLKQKFQFSTTSRTVLFLADPQREAKNFSLAEKAIKFLNISGVEFQVRYNQPKDQISMIINAADVILLTSKWEGSPNVIKEAMACNCSIVATDVGDIRWLFGNEPGHFITSFEPHDVAEKIKHAIEFSQKYGWTKGRDRIIKLGLDSETVANKIISVYQSVLNNGK